VGVQGKTKAEFWWKNCSERNCISHR